MALTDAELRLHAFLLNGGSSKNLESLLPDEVLHHDFLRHLESVGDQILASDDDVDDLQKLLAGISAFQLFVQCNVVGPIPSGDDELHNRISTIVSRMKSQDGEKNDSSSSSSSSPRSALNLDGESAYPLINFPHLLLFAKSCFSTCSSTAPSASWWRFRADWMHQRALQEPVETLRSSIVDALIPEIAASPFLSRLPKTHRALFHLEAYHALHYYSKAKEAAKSLQMAVESADVDLKLFGAMGKRTKFQVEDKCQLVVSVGGGGGGGGGGGDADAVLEESDKWWLAGTGKGSAESKVENSETSEDSWWHSDAPKDVTLDDDTLLDKIKFRDDVDKVAARKRQWNPVEQAVVFCLMTDVGRRSCVKELTEEEMAAFRNALLDQDKKVFGVQAGSLFYRCRGEKDKSRKVERSLMQIEELTTVVRRGFSEGSSALTLSTSTSSSSCSSSAANYGHRVFLTHTLCLPFIWTVETLMADIMISLGLTFAALDVYLRLEAWTNVVDCYKKQGKRGAAEKLIRDKVDLTNDPNMLCVLGDVTLDPSHYEEAWSLSKGKCARAMRTLGYDHLYKHRPEEAIECFEKSLGVNALQIPVWYSLGCTALFVDDNKKAEKAFLRCVHLDYDNYEAWTNLASAQVKLGFKDKACNTLQEALKCNFENWRIWENFLVVSADVGHPEDVIRAYHRLLDLKGEKYSDPEVLMVLVTLMKKLKESFEPEDEPNLQAFQRLEKKCRELFGRVTCSITDNADIWKAYATLYLQIQLTSSTSSNDNNNHSDAADRQLKGLQYIQRSLRCLTQKSGWELEVASVEETLQKSNALVQTIIDEDNAAATSSDGATGGASSGVTPAILASLKMVVRSTIAKVDKKYGETLPSQNSKAEIERMKGFLTSIDKRLKAKKGS